VKGLPSTIKFSQNGARIYPVYNSEFIVSENEMALIVLVALTAHHTPNIM
jgi:hypothetical protein